MAKEIGDFEPLKKAFLANGWEWDENDKLFSNILVKNKGDMYLYNYSDAFLVPRGHSVIKKCRGIVVTKDGKLLNYPFDRFFNEFEEEKADIDWATASVQEKVDGSLICTFWNGNDWEVTTRGSFYPFEKASVDFSELFRESFNNFDMLDKGCCYIFEIVTKANRIITWYDDDAVYLLGARNLATFKELGVVALNVLAKQLNVLRPKLYSASDIEQCKKLFKQLREDEEGLVIVDGNFNRIKLKQDSYLLLSKIKMLKEQDMFEYVLGLSQIDQEYLKKFPDVIKQIEDIRIKWSNIQDKTKEIFEIIKDKPTRKEFAMEANKYPFKGLLFTMLDGRELNKKILKWENIKEWRI